MTGRTSRASRLTMPLARGAIRVLAEARGGCVRPVQLRRANLDTGQVDQQIIARGCTLEATCPACAKRARNLRAQWPPVPKASCRRGLPGWMPAWPAQCGPSTSPASVTADTIVTHLVTHFPGTPHRSLAEVIRSRGSPDRCFRVSGR